MRDESGSDAGGTVPCRRKFAAHLISVKYAGPVDPVTCSSHLGPPLMSDVPFPILVAAIFLFGCLAILHVHRRQQEAQRALPLRDAYLATHRQQTPACTHCASTETREFGLDEGEDPRRIVACVKCDRLMYQYRRATTD